MTCPGPALPTTHRRHLRHAPAVVCLNLGVKGQISDRSDLGGAGWGGGGGRLLTSLPSPPAGRTHSSKGLPGLASHVAPRRGEAGQLPGACGHTPGCPCNTQGNQSRESLVLVLPRPGPHFLYPSAMFLSTCHVPAIILGTEDTTESKTNLPLRDMQSRKKERK